VLSRIRTRGGDWGFISGRPGARGNRNSFPISHCRLRRDPPGSCVPEPMKKKTGGAAHPPPRMDFIGYFGCQRTRLTRPPIPRNGRAVPKNRLASAETGRLFRGTHDLLHGTHHLFRGAGHRFAERIAHSTKQLARSAERIARSRERKAQIPAPDFAPRRLSSGPGLEQVTKKRGPLWPPEHDFGRSARPWPRKTA